VTPRRGPIELLRNAYRALGRVDRKVEEADLRLKRLELALARLEGAIRALAADEKGSRARLERLRAEADYERAWTEPRPLVSVTVATIGRDQLTDLALPSILAQSHRELEVIVAGDQASADTQERIRALGDQRVRYLDLGPQTSWTDDPRKQWLVGATRARHAALRDATGRWIVHFDDDDAMRPDCLESLLELARESRAEAVYGRILSHRGSAAAKEIGVYPPRENQFSWAAGLYHAGLRFLEPELLPAEIGVPGDWWLAERMLRAGVRFAMRERVLCDVYPSDRRPAD
jgi:glycosyltransferase involved in cell wall biosynthesis